MENGEFEKKAERWEKAPSPLQLRLGTLRSSRLTFARVLRGYNSGTVDEKTYRGLVWGLGLYINYLRLEKEAEIEKRLEALEAAAGEKN